MAHGPRHTRIVPSHRVAILIPDHFAVFQLGVAIEIFARPHPELELDWYDVRVCAGKPGIAIATASLFDVAVHHGAEALTWADTIIIPQAATLAQPADPVVLDGIRAAHLRGARFITFCSGSFVLAAAGVLDGRTATTHWKYAQQLAETYPRVRVNPEVLYVDDGQVLTSAGTGAALDLSLHVVRMDHGARVARKIARSLVIAPHREGGQAQFIASATPVRRTADDALTRTADYALNHLHEQLSVDALAAKAHMSTRNFTRRFRQLTGQTPARWVAEQRLSKVRQLLEETDMPIEDIAVETGFSSPATLRHQFASMFLTTPSGYRRSFRTGYDDLAPTA